MKKALWLLFFTALVSVVLFLPESNFSNRIRELALLLTAPTSLFLIAFVFQGPIKTFLDEKARNLANKQDIDELTRKVEAVKLQNSMLLEDHKTENQLRTAVLEERFRTHQQAYTHWLRMMSSYPSDRGVKTALECERWWIKKCLYLDPEPRLAFAEAYKAARGHKELLDARFESSILIENGNKIRQAGPIIEKAIGVPNIVDTETAEDFAASDESVWDHDNEEWPAEVTVNVPKGTVIRLTHTEAEE